MNTTHGMIGFKCIGLWRGDGLSEMAYRVIKNDSDMIDDMLIDSEWCAEMCPDGMIYYGNYLRTGDPRVDILYGDKTYFREKFRKEHGLSFDTKIVLFAPTFREANKSGKRSVYENQWTLDFERLLKNFEKKFGGNWVICLRLHPQLAEAAGEYKDEKLGNKLIDVTKIEDLYEIMAAVDACVSDYSTTAFDSSLMHIPVFLYADDIDSYLKDRGGMIWNISSDTDAVVTNKKEMTPNIDVVLPFSISQNNDEFERKILGFDEKEYLEKLEAFEKGVQLVFDGKASDRAVDRIEEYLLRE
jgi:CDP-glycerol glycerophosphotransferase